MKRYCIAVVCILVAGVGCVKHIEPADYTNPKVQGCAIQQLLLNSGYPGSGIKTISYNADGNPTDVVNTSGYEDYILEDYHFRYDRWGRLTDYYLNLEGNLGALFWHRYSYPDHQTVFDTTFIYAGSINDPEPPHSGYQTEVDILKLDNKGRIVKDYPVDMTTNMPSSVPNVADYDSRGNLVRSGVTYDNSINPYQTNYVWMFIFRDFSQNNPSRDAGNAYVVYTNLDRRGLPVTLAMGFPPYATPVLFNYNYTRMDIQYSCDASR